MEAKRSDRQKERTARQQEKERAAAKKGYLESLISRKDLIEKYGISEKDVTKALKGVEPDEVEEIRGMSWGRNNRGRYLYRSDNPAILRLLPLPMERMHEEYDYNR
jgi:hypothetical protein